MNQGNPIIGRPASSRNLGRNMGRSAIDGSISLARRNIGRLEKELADARNHCQALLLEKYNSRVKAQEFVDANYGKMGQ